MRLASRFGYANQIRRDRPLTREELMQVVPSVFGEDTGPSDSWWQPGFLLCGTRSALTRHRHNHITPVFTFIFCLQRYPTMKIITRGEAMRIHRQHPASRLFPFCTGKYRWHGSAEAYTGREVQDIPGVLAVFAERRKDSFGPYVRLMSVTLN